MWSKPGDSDQPRDAAYALGSRIVEAYYRKVAENAKPCKPSSPLRTIRASSKKAATDRTPSPSRSIVGQLDQWHWIGGIIEVIVAVERLLQYAAVDIDIEMLQQIERHFFEMAIQVAAQKIGTQLRQVMRTVDSAVRCNR